MGVLTATPFLPSKLDSLLSQENKSLFPFRRKLKQKKYNKPIVPVSRLFGPAIFEASKLKVVFLKGVDEKKHPGNSQRTYTLTHSDISSKLTLAISNSINNSQLQGWYNWLQRDEVLAEWKKVKGKMSLHVHCHISGGHFLLDFCAKLRFFIFYKELPVVLNAFVHGDMDLFNNYPELQEALVWVHFHSKIPEFNRVECWGPLKDAANTNSSGPKNQDKIKKQTTPVSNWDLLEEACPGTCNCCFPPITSIPWSSPPPPQLLSQIESGSTSFLQQGTQQQS